MAGTQDFASLRLSGLHHFELPAGNELRLFWFLCGELHNISYL
jgi:hypothetical protein